MAYPVDLLPLTNDNRQRHNYSGKVVNGGYRRGNGSGHRYNNDGNGGYGQAYSYCPNRQVYAAGKFYYDERQQERGGHFYSGENQGYRRGEARRQTWQPEHKAFANAGTDAHEHGHLVAMVKVKLSGSQKRKLKRKAMAQREKAKQYEVDFWKKQIAVKPKTIVKVKKQVTLDEYEKVREERKKTLPTTTTVVRKILEEEFKGLQLLEKKANQEEAIKKPKQIEHRYGIYYRS